MNSKKIEHHFNEYMTNKINLKSAKKNDEIAIIFGKDQFKISNKKQSIKIPIFGWINFGKINYKLKEVDWIAIKKNGDECDVTIATGFSPFDEIDKNSLYNGSQIFAIPYNLYARAFF